MAELDGDMLAVSKDAAELNIHAEQDAAVLDFFCGVLERLLHQCSHGVDEFVLVLAQQSDVIHKGLNGLCCHGWAEVMLAGAATRLRLVRGLRRRFVDTLGEHPV
jgi:hypothetical protein